MWWENYGDREKCALCDRRPRPWAYRAFIEPLGENDVSVRLCSKHAKLYTQSTLALDPRMLLRVGPPIVYRRNESLAPYTAPYRE